MDQVERITQMEAILNAGLSAVSRLEQALTCYEAIRRDLQTLEEYYLSGLWRYDFECDSAGLLPAGLSRGVLSEDAVYDLLSARDELYERMRVIADEGDLSD